MTPKKKNYSDHCRDCAKSVWQVSRRMDQHLTDLRAAAYTMDEDGTNPFKVTAKSIRQNIRLLHSCMDLLGDYASWWADAMEDEQYDSNEDNTNQLNDYENDYN